MRLIARDKFKKLESTVNGLFIIRQFKELALFRSEGDKALFSGFNTKQIKQKLKIPIERPLADFIDTKIIHAKTKALEMTINFWKKNFNISETDIIKKHYENNLFIRNDLFYKQTYPENLLIEKDIDLIKEQQKEIIKNILNINVSKDLGYLALFIMFFQENQTIQTKDLKIELLGYRGIFPEKYMNINPLKKEPYCYQIIRNLKSNKKNKVNIIRMGYCLDIYGGFKLTPKGIEFVENYFINYLSPNK